MFARDGYSTIAIVFAFSAVTAAVLLYFWEHWLSYSIVAALVLVCAFILFFFRDPDRDVPENPNLIVSPADGKVVLVKDVEEEVYMKGTATQISIFLFPLDVHVNRVPATGTIEYIRYHPGVYLLAWDERASSMNERADFGLKHTSGRKILFRQITGFMARRIVYHLVENETVKAGMRFGMMKFGSRMDILVPPDFEVKVKEGDRTVGGESILASLSSH